MLLRAVIPETAKRLERGKRKLRARTQSRAFWSGPRGDRHGARDLNVTAATENGAGMLPARHTDSIFNFPWYLVFVLGSLGVYNLFMEYPVRKGR